ncbi:MAG: large subunit ribosomal protein [Patescibacteria group bacterium]|nr:large subunit ribosomal protein [Patescibacteria group bacterium]
MAHTKAGGSTKLGRDSASKRLGLKVFDQQSVKAGNVLIRQRGTKWLNGLNTKVGSDDTIYSLIEGRVKFSVQRKKDFTGKIKKVSVINVIPLKKEEK